MLNNEKYLENPVTCCFVFDVIIRTSLLSIKVIYQFFNNTFAWAGIIFLAKGTLSFSALIIATISCWSVNSSLDIPSKHFFKWGCTRNGSLVSDRISSSSSFDRKKNLMVQKIPKLKSTECQFQKTYKSIWKKCTTIIYLINGRSTRHIAHRNL